MFVKRFDIEEELATADVMFKAYGNTLAEAFENAGYAMFEIMTDAKKIAPKISFAFEKNAEDLKSLLYDFLEELLYLHETKDVFLSEFHVELDEKNYSLKAVVKGEKIKDTHERRCVVKAVTYFDMDIKKIGKRYVVQVVLDL